MTAFELFFGLTSVILGLALAQLANSLQLLLRAGRRVSWSIEPVLQSVLILLIIVSVWASQWWERDSQTFSVGQCLLQVVKLLALFVAASAALPETDGDRKIDLRRHYYGSRSVTYGALIAGLILFSIYGYAFGRATITLASAAEDLAFPAVYAVLVFMRWRPLHVIVLSLVTSLFGMQIAGLSFGG